MHLDITMVGCGIPMASFYFQARYAAQNAHRRAAIVAAARVHRLGGGGVEIRHESHVVAATYLSSEPFNQAFKISFRQVVRSALAELFGGHCRRQLCAAVGAFHLVWHPAPESAPFCDYEHQL